MVCFLQGWTFCRNHRAVRDFLESLGREEAADFLLKQTWFMPDSIETSCIIQLPGVMVFGIAGCDAHFTTSSGTNAAVALNVPDYPSQETIDLAYAYMASNGLQYNESMMKFAPFFLGGDMSELSAYEESCVSLGDLSKM